jgi:hypothetical protein
MKTIGLLQPGRLGDILICAPIAKYYYDRGYRVIWPIFENFYSMVSEAIDYTEFYPVTKNVYQSVTEARAILNDLNITNILDIAATFPGSECTNEYVNCGDGLGRETFDMFKYRKANVPFEEKWNFTYKRNYVEEERVFNLIVKQTPYDIVGTKFSGGDLILKFESKHTIINFTNDFSIFHWRKVFEEAKHIALVDSAMANFIEQINIPNKKTLIKLANRPAPTFRNSWKYITI